MKTKYILAASTLILALASCTSEVEEAVSSQKVPLQIQVEIENSSRAANVTDTDFKEGESFLLGYEYHGEEAWVFPGAHYNVATYTKGQWSLAEDVKFNDGLSLRAYYPADSKGYNEGSGVSFRLKAEAGRNHMVSDYFKVSADDPIAKITFKHIMARVRFEVVNPTKVPLSSITLNNIPLTDEFSYSWNGFTSDYGILTIDNPSPSPTEKQIIDVPLIPNPYSDYYEETTLTLNYEDGKSYRTELNFPKLEMGHYYIVPVTISKGEEGNDDPEAFTITTSILDWTEQNMNELEITNKDVVE